jgi:hypothetical protein
LDQAEEAAQLEALREWVNGVLLVDYLESDGGPSSAGTPGCRWLLTATPAYVNVC